MSQQNMRCDDCRFWERIDKDELYDFEGPPWANESTGAATFGRCRRMPPVVVGGAIRELLALPFYKEAGASHDTHSVIQGASLWPSTWKDDWCREWEEIGQA